MKKLSKLIVIVLAAALTLTLAACSAFQYDKDAAAKRAKEITDVANTADYQAVYDLLPKAMQDGTSVDALKSGWDPMFKQAGAFVAYKSTVSSGIVQNGVKYIVVIVTCEFEKGTLIYTISLTTDMEIAGLYMKPGV